MSRQLLLLVGLIHLLCLVDLVIMRLTFLGFIDAAGLGTAPMDGEKKNIFPPLSRTTPCIHNGSLSMGESISHPTDNPLPGLSSCRGGKC